MTSEDVRSEIEREPFGPIRLHLVSGKEIAIHHAWKPILLQNAVMILSAADGDVHDIVSLRNIERLERLG